MKRPGNLGPVATAHLLYKVVLKINRAGGNVAYKAEWDQYLFPDKILYQCGLGAFWGGGIVKAPNWVRGVCKINSKQSPILRPRLHNRGDKCRLVVLQWEGLGIKIIWLQGAALCCQTHLVHHTLPSRGTVGENLGHGLLRGAATALELSLPGGLRLCTLSRRSLIPLVLSIPPLHCLF